MFILTLIVEHKFEYVFIGGDHCFSKSFFFKYRKGIYVFAKVETL